MARSEIPPLHEYVGANVQRLRRRRGLTQEELADRLGVDVRYLRRLERGVMDIRLTTLARLASVLGVVVGLLLRRVGLPQPRVGRPPKSRATSSPSSSHHERRLSSVTE